MQSLAFIVSPSLASSSQRRGHGTSRRRRLQMAGKGFDPSDKPASPPASKGPSSTPGPARTPGIDDDYVPRGPTLREEYERRGLVTPQVGRDSGVLPEIVADRMLRRILTFGGVPLGLLFSFFAAYFVLKYKYDITVIPGVVAYSTLGTIGMATMGITYGIFSSSWDEDEEGSRLGWKEAKTNFVRAKDGLFSAREREKREDEYDRIDQLDE